MWKATATLDQKVIDVKNDDDLDWDSDPDFVNKISEKDQRWGKQKTIEDTSSVQVENMAEFRQKIVQSNDQQNNQEWQKKAAETKKSYGVQRTG